jgi:hypothetical protein
VSAGARPRPTFAPDPASGLSPLREADGGLPQPETPSWKRLAKADLRRFLVERGRRDDAIASVARQCLGDDEFPFAQPHQVIRYLAVWGATREVLAAAREMLKEFRRWRASKLDAELAEIARTNANRAAALRESLEESREIASDAYSKDASRW